MPAPAPTYWTETTDEGQTVYHCAYCQQQGAEHHSTDEVMFIKHMEQRHDGRMVEDTEASAAAQAGRLKTIRTAAPPDKQVSIPMADRQGKPASIPMADRQGKPASIPSMSRRRTPSIPSYSLTRSRMSSTTRSRSRRESRLWTMTIPFSSSWARRRICPCIGCPRKGAVLSVICSVLRIRHTASSSLMCI